MIPNMLSVSTVKIMCHDEQSHIIQQCKDEKS